MTHTATWSVEVWGNNHRWLARLHNAGMIYNPHAQRWHRGGLSEAQAKSLVGRMRQAGLKAMIFADRPVRSAKAQWRPYVPTPYEIAQRESAARQAIEQAAQKRHRKRKHKDGARKTYEEPPSAP